MIENKNINKKIISQNNLIFSDPNMSDFSKEVIDLRNKGYLKLSLQEKFTFKTISSILDKAKNISEDKVFLLDPETALLKDIELTEAITKRIFCNNQLYEICAKYLNAEPIINYFFFQRAHKKKNIEFGSGRYHIDGGGNFLKIFVFFNDNNLNTISTKYVEGSHKLFYEDKFFGNTRFTDKELKQHTKKKKIANLSGKNGELIIFDPNGIHSGDYSKKNHRDILLIQISSLYQYLELQKHGFRFGKYSFKIPRKHFKLIKNSKFFKHHPYKKRFFDSNVTFGEEKNHFSPSAIFLK